MAVEPSVVENVTPSCVITFFPRFPAVSFELSLTGSPHGLAAKSKVTVSLANALDGKNNTAIKSAKNENVIFFMFVIIVITSPAVDADNKLFSFMFDVASADGFHSSRLRSKNRSRNSKTDFLLGLVFFIVSMIIFIYWL